LRDFGYVAGVVYAAVMGAVERQAQFFQGFAHAAGLDAETPGKKSFQVYVILKAFREREAVPGAVYDYLFNVVIPPGTEGDWAGAYPREEPGKDGLKIFGFIHLLLADAGQVFAEIAEMCV